MTRWLPIAAAVVLAVAGLVIPFLHYEASADIVTVECGNGFQGIGGGPDFLVITEGFEEARSLSSGEVQAELASASDSCESQATARLVIAGALVLAALLVAIAGPRILGRRRRAPGLEP
jgi:hypothetical protein